MRCRFLLAIGLLGVFGGRLPSADACGGPDFVLRKAAQNAVAEDREVADKAIKHLRNAGPDGLEALIEVHIKEIDEHTAPKLTVNEQTPTKADPAWDRLKAALDAVAGQRDCHTAQMYWYTDLDKAKQAAQAEGKPILSLRLLGNLTDEFSCANSRFFRTTLYANAEVSKALRERFVLHWQSVRPVPKVTIDFGDGRKLERTLTGNSIHYVLDSRGRVVDALPGLYGPKAFLQGLDRAEAVAKQTASLPEFERFAALATYHRERSAAIMKQWQEDLATLGISPALVEATANSPTEEHSATYTSAAGARVPPTAAKAAPRALGKGAIEVPILKATAVAPEESLASATTDEIWKRIAGLHTRDAALDTTSVALIRSQHPTAAKAAPRAVSKMFVEDPLIRMVRSFQGAIALDTVRNEYTFHRQIHAWLGDTAGARIEPALDQFNERVYAELFLTPSSDPWLGLMPADVYTALEANGVVTAAAGR